MNMLKRLAGLLLLCSMSSCTIISAVDAVASTAIDATALVVKGGTKVVSKTADIVLPDGDDKKDKDKDED